jgi:hypothetical protein
VCRLSKIPFRKQKQLSNPYFREHGNNRRVTLVLYGEKSG